MSAEHEQHAETGLRLTRDIRIQARIRILEGRVHALEELRPEHLTEAGRAHVEQALARHAEALRELAAKT